MKTMNETKLTFRALEIDEDDVKKETSREVLISWRLEVTKALTVTKNRITGIQRKFRRYGVEMDSDQYIKLKHAHEFIKAFDNVIGMRLQQLRDQKQEGVEKLFIQAAKAKLPFDLYREIWKEAESTFSKQANGL